ncbi:MAG: AIM24 family protein [Muribaculaceae bacterium]|nr:AIM24 family protein [Muribaculaceae bacterium]MDE6755492.1 AIM24 family protein [Muribaculaceae bacterium]
MNCKLKGAFIKHLEVELFPGEEFYAEKGALIYIEEGLDMNSEFNGNSLGKLLGSTISGESLMIVHYRNNTPQPRRLVIGSRGGMIHFKLSGSEIICNRGAYVASNKKVDLSAKLSLSGFLGGIGGLLQRVSGDATIFLSTHGDPIIVDLSPGQAITIDEQHFLALEGIPENRISPQFSARNLFGGEGLRMLSVRGPGKVYLNP